ncbi:MAG: chemotaxis protein CheX [Myxococcota bacterium]
MDNHTTWAPPQTPGTGKARQGLLKLDMDLVDRIVEGCHEGLSMADIKPPAIGASRLVNLARPYAVIVGLVGEDSGSMTMGLSGEAALFMVNSLMGTQSTRIEDEELDALMEIGNITAGCVRNKLVDMHYNINNISLPALVLGANYHVHQSKGVKTCSVEFELEELPVHLYRERFFTVSVSLRR